MAMMRRTYLLRAFLLGVIALSLGAPSWAAKFSIERIYIEYNSSANDLGFHVSLDGEDWKTLKIVNPAGVTVLDLTGRGPYAALGLTELFFEGAEPSLDDYPLDRLLAQFPEGQYKFSGLTTDGTRIASSALLSHAVPDGPAVSSEVDDDTVVIRWSAVTDHPAGFPNRRIQIVGYQILVDPFEVTLPASSREVTLPREFVESLKPGEHQFEVLAIDSSGNQTITEGSFETD
jgi:hypothetical protein